MKHVFLMMVLFSFSFAVMAEDELGEKETICEAMAESNYLSGTKNVPQTSQEEQTRQTTAVGQ